MAKASRGVRKIGRDAKTGRIISVEEAGRRRGTAVVETVPVPKPKPPSKPKPPKK